ncbi:MAG: NAD(P)/FAD-dependent oxidoreductase [Vicinamibacterales bacterium]
MPPTFVVVGASLAGATAAATLRAEGFEGHITLIGAERHPPYERPPMSKRYLRGETPFEQARIHPSGFYADHRIEALFGIRATRVEPAERVVHLDTGQRLRYDRLLIATGARNRRPPIPGLDLAGVLDLRTLDDADVLRAHATPAARAVVVGMGFIGCEVAASLRQMGLEVVAVESSPAPLCGVLGRDIGAVVARLHRTHGVDLIVDDTVLRFEGHGRVSRVITRRGRCLECDFVVAGLGVEPAVDFLATSGVGLSNGILVDEYCRSGAEGIYAAGDVANHLHPVFGRRIRVEHWQNAMQQGAAAARNMLGPGRPYDAIHWFWSDQYDANLQYAGFHDEWDALVVRGSLEAPSFLAFYLNQGRIDAVVGLNCGKDVRRAMPLIRSRHFVDPARLADEDTDLRSLVPVSATKGLT